MSESFMLSDSEKRMFNNIAKKDSKPVGNIILNLTGCKFCQAFGIDNQCQNKRSCTEYIDDFIKNKYLK